MRRAAPLGVRTRKKPEMTTTTESIPTSAEQQALLKQPPEAAFLIQGADGQAPHSGGYQRCQVPDETIVTWTTKIARLPASGGWHAMVYTRTAEFAFERDSFLLLAQSERAAPALHRRFLDRGSSGANVGRRRLAAGRTAAGAAGRVGCVRRPSRVGGAGAVAIHVCRVLGSRTQADEAGRRKAQPASQSPFECAMEQ